MFRPNHEDNKCVSCETIGATQFTYNVIRKEKLCENCAEAKQVQRHDVVSFCETHKTCQLRHFCDTHNAPLCRKCVFQERKDQLSDLVKRAQAKQHEIMRGGGKIHQQELDVNRHFLETEIKINVAGKEGMEMVERVKEQKAERINREANDEINRINKERNDKLQENQNSAQNELKTIQNNLKDLLAKLHHLKIMCKFNETNTLSENIAKAEKLDGDMIFSKEFHHIVQSLVDGIDHGLNIDGVERVATLAKEVTFTKEDGTEVGRIDVPTEEWEEVPGAECSTGISGSNCMIGTISETELVIKNVTNGTVYVTNLGNTGTRSVMVREAPSNIYSCAASADGVIVCGTMYGEIIVCDKMWNRIRTRDVRNDIKCRSQLQVDKLFISADIDDEGRIIAAAYGGADIHIYDPNKGKHVRSISSQGKPIHEVHALSSGNIAFKTKCEEGTDICILDEMGIVSRHGLHHFHDKDLLSFTVDRSRNAVYILLFDQKLNDHEVYVISSTGVATTKISLELEESLAEIEFLPESGQIIIQDGANLTLYQKTKPGLDEIVRDIK